MISWFKLGLVMIVMAFGLSACGVRGGLEAPPEDKAAQSESQGEPGEEKPHEPFILDTLIR